MSGSLRRNRSRSGFTLIELVISASLMALILGSAYVCLNAAFSSQKLIEPRLDAVQNARVALDLMVADLRAACPLSKEYELIGMQRRLGEAHADNLDFGTHNYTPRRFGEGDFSQVSFFLDSDPETGQLSLWRRRNPRLAPDPLVGGSREELAKGVRGLQFEYFDGIDWYDSWGETPGTAKAQSSQRAQPNLSGLPEAIRITLWCDSARKPGRSASSAGEPEPPLMFQTVVRLNLADRLSPAATSNSSTNNPAQTKPQTEEPTGPPRSSP